MGNYFTMGDKSDSDEFVNLDYGLLRGNKCELSTSHLAMDSNIFNNKPRNDCQQSNINIFDLKLDQEDQIELIYLLYPNCHDAYADMLSVLRGNSINVLQKWIMTNENMDQSILQKQVIEALAIIQNYRVLKLLGYSKESLINFLPNQRNTAIHIDKHKKYFYRMFEDMGVEMELKFLNLVEQDMAENNFSFKEFNCLELYFTYFETINYIKRNNYRNILKHLKVLQLDVNYEDIKNMQGSGTEIRQSFHLNFDETVNRRLSESRLCQNLETIRRSASRNEDSYPMDPKNPGVCLILDNEEFYTEFDEQYKDLVLKSEKKIESRKGTRNDSERLESIFKKLGFTVILHRNKTHEEIKDIVLNTCRNVRIEDSSFFIIFMSHGAEGAIIASNCIPLQIEDIKSWVYDFPVLNKKPKVLIFQCCQGQKFHIDGLSEDNTLDESELKGNISKKDGMDILELHSALYGFVSIRDEYNGTWMIQSLCEILEEDTGEHFLDICITVQRKVRSKNGFRKNKGKVETIKMVCEYKSTFEKKLFLPKLRTNNHNELY